MFFFFFFFNVVQNAVFHIVPHFGNLTEILQNEKLLTYAIKQGFPGRMQPARKIHAGSNNRPNVKLLILRTKVLANEKLS